MNKTYTRTKSWAILLALLLFFGDYTIYSFVDAAADSSRQKDSFAAALETYRDGSYKAALLKLESILLQEAVKPGLQAKVFLLLGVCCEKLEEKDRASAYFLKFKEMLDKGAVDLIPVVRGIEPESFASYREVFAEQSFFAHKEPLAVSEVIRKNVVHAPRKTVEQKEKEKKKKKFPWLLAIGTAVVVGTAAVLILAAKKGKNKFDMPAIDRCFPAGGNFNAPPRCVALDSIKNLRRLS
ncbi:MAG: hypothetical protein KAW12_30400 [Candidatus Aminicenantes bacterium]|nr:hypothetical protein [Candidatus Aminicenantes bacterium]